jgi:hypothetical protein
MDLRRTRHWKERPTVTKFFLGIAIAATALGTAAPASAESDSPFSHLCMVGQCSTPAPATVRHYDLSQVQAGIRQGLKFAPSPSN